MASKRKKNRVKFKWTKELIILLVLIVAMIGATIALSFPTAERKRIDKYNNAITTYNTENNTSYSTLSDKERFRDISFSDLYKKKKSSSYTMVFYTTLKTGDFIAQMAKIDSLAEKFELKYIYILYASYVSDASTDKKETKDYRDHLDDLEEEINSDVDKDQDPFDMETYPVVLLFKDNTLIFNSETYKDDTNSSFALCITKAFSLTYDDDKATE